MSRFNIFSRIHKALGAMLYDTSLTLQQASFAHKDDADPSLRKLQQLLDVFDKHTENDDNYILPAIRQYEPSVADFFEQAHAEEHILANKLRTLIAGYKRAVSIAERKQVGQTINSAFTAFMDFNLAQMANEEIELNKVLWQYYSDMELMIINQRSATPLSSDEVSSAIWMVRGLSNAEIVGLLKAVKKIAPDSVFNSLFVITEKELPGIRFHQVMESFSSASMVA